MGIKAYPPYSVKRFLRYVFGWSLRFGEIVPGRSVDSITVTILRIAATVFKRDLKLLKKRARRAVAGQKEKGEALASPLKYPGAELLLGRSYLFLLFLDQGCALTETLAEVSELGATNSTLALDFDLVHARGMQREDTFHTFAIADAAHSEGLIETTTALADDDARKNLDTFLVAFDDLGMHFHGIADTELGVIFPKLFRLNFV